MAFQPVSENYRVEVTPAGSDGFHTRDDEHDARILLDIVQAAVRVSWYKGATVRLLSDTVSRCSHCGALEDGSVMTSPADFCQPEDEIGMPVCCETARAEYSAAKSAERTAQ